MNFDRARFPVIDYLETHYPQIEQEVLHMPEDMYEVYRDYAASNNPWYCAALFAFESNPNVKNNPERQRQVVPNTWRLMEAHPQICLAAASVLTHDTHLHAHTDDKIPDSIRIHMGVQVPDECALRVAGDLIRWRRGIATVFDGEVDHEAINLSLEPRIILIVDFIPTPEEAAYWKQVKASMDPRWMISGIGAGLFSEAEVRSGLEFTRELPDSATGH